METESSLLHLQGLATCPWWIESMTSPSYFLKVRLNIYIVYSVVGINCSCRDFFQTSTKPELRKIEVHYLSALSVCEYSIEVPAYDRGVKHWAQHATEIFHVLSVWCIRWRIYFNYSEAAILSCHAPPRRQLLEVPWLRLSLRVQPITFNHYNTVSSAF
jgi:hypothetical protein